MITSRHIFTVKERRLEEATEHLRWWLNRLSPHESRFYAPIKGASSNVLVYDEEFDSMAALETSMNNRCSDPDIKPAREKSRELAGGVQYEVWRVVAPG